MLVTTMEKGIAFKVTLSRYILIMHYYGIEFKSYLNMYDIARYIDMVGLIHIKNY